MNIFVAKLNPSTDEDSLRELFGSFGEVKSARVIMDRDTGRSKCYGFVDMESDEAGRNAIDALNDFEFEGNNIVVKESEPREDRGDRGGRRFDNNRRNNNRDGYRRDNNRGGGDRRRSNDRGNSGFDTNRW